MKKKKSAFAKYSRQDKVLLTIGYVLLGLFVIAIIVPMIYIVVASFMDPITLQNKGITFDFSKWTTTAYERVMTNSQIWIGALLGPVYRCLRDRDASGGLSPVKSGFPGKRIFQCDFHDHHVFRGRTDSDLFDRE